LILLARHACQAENQFENLLTVDHKRFVVDSQQVLDSGQPVEAAQVLMLRDIVDLVCRQEPADKA
jgi:hypothetical protein